MTTVELNVGFNAGDVVVSGRQAFLVVLVDGRAVKLVRVISPTTAKHRAHVQPHSWCDLATSGLTKADVIFACDKIVRAQRADLRCIGRVSPGLLAQVTRAILREHSTRSMEREPAVNSNLVALTASLGRRIGAVRYA